MNIRLKNILSEVGILSLGLIIDMLNDIKNNGSDENNSQSNEKKGD